MTVGLDGYQKFRLGKGKSQNDKLIGFSLEKSCRGKVVIAGGNHLHADRGLLRITSLLISLDANVEGIGSFVTQQILHSHRPDGLVEHDTVATVHTVDESSRLELQLPIIIIGVAQFIAQAAGLHDALRLRVDGHRHDARAIDALKVVDDGGGIRAVGAFLASMILDENAPLHYCYGRVVDAVGQNGDRVGDLFDVLVNHNQPLVLIDMGTGGEGS